MTTLDYDSALAFDRLALDLLSRDIRNLKPADWDRPTPCDGWSVRDLIEHMITEHVTISGGYRPPLDAVAAFDAVAAQWITFFSNRGGRKVHVPSQDSEQEVHLVLAVHLADMVIHRWDLGAACGREIDVPASLLEAAEAVAELATATGSPLVGDGRAYQPALPQTPKDQPLDSLVRRYGRDPRWRHRA